MKFQIVIRNFTELMSGANFPLLMFSGFLGLFIILFILWRWGAGFLMSATFILVGLQMVKSEVLGGIALMGRFVLVTILVFYTFFSRKNKVNLSPATRVLLLLPIVMLINSPRAVDGMDAINQTVLMFSFYIGLLLGGQKILSDPRGRATYTKFLTLFLVVMAFVQIPYLGSSYDRFEGSFSNVVGFMIVGMTGVIVLTWFGMKQRIWSIAFFFFIGTAALTIFFMALTAGRTALGGAFLGVLVLLSRKLKRNVVVALAVSIIVGPIVIKAVMSFAGFEAVRQKLFATEGSGRGELYALAWREVKSSSVFGQGTGVAAYQGVVGGFTQYHNSYLEFAIDHGIPFALIMLLLFLWLPFRGLVLMRRCYTEEMKNMMNLSSALLAGYLFSSFLGGTLLMTSGILPTFMAIALQEGVRSENQQIERYGISDYEEDYVEDYEYEELLYVDYQGDVRYSDEGTLYG